MDIKAQVIGNTIHLEALGADGDSWMGSRDFTPAGPGKFTYDRRDASNCARTELAQIVICAGWDGIKVEVLDANEEWGFCGCGVELSAMTSSDGEQCDDCNDQAGQ